MSSARAVTPAERSAFERDGFVHLPGLYDPCDIARLCDALAAAERSTLASETDRQLRRDSFFWRRSPEVAAFACDPMLGEVASDLLGARGVRLIHDVLLEKMRGQTPTPWHRDRDFWSFEGRGALTMWIPLRATPRRMGPLRYARGSHRERDLAPLRRIEKVWIPTRFHVASYDLELGDAVAHHHATLHCAGRNRAREMRRAFAIHLIDADARFVASAGAGHVEHASRCGWDALPDRAPFTDEIAPLLYTR